ncbi:DUF3179 domain-containing protein [Halogeometricum borinquense]|uniref:DUF3179 domain-containing protein n=1 Tax=Halogeometricum borinquense TaxID=60847 RepID=A0A482T632_9EURY|nr:DUF3179 domain-containing protein [Halogeometricum borinquense]RYJ13194.1 DUF3179 domain-containing protein [Halogeometricum borinquense]
MTDKRERSGDHDRDHDVQQVLPPDAIPSVDNPTFGPADEYDGDGSDDVIVVEIAGDARAYPVRFLHYHEIVNDEFGSVPVAVTWCPLCGSAVVYDRRVAEAAPADDDADVPDHAVLELGVSGKLADDDLVMYDRETGSEWKQSSGACLSGVHEGMRLAVLPAATTTAEAFARDYDDGAMLRPPGGESEAASDSDEPASIEYDADPYEAYFEMPGYGLGAHRGTGGRDDWPQSLSTAGVEPKSIVAGLERDEDALCIPLEVAEATGGVVRVTVGDDEAVVFATADGIHAFEAPSFELEPTDEEGMFVGDGTTWHGGTGRADDGRTLDRLPVRRLFAFAWCDDHGRDAFFLDE